MRIIGIDPGFAETGYGVIEKNNDVFCVIDYGVIRTSPKDDMGIRLKKIYEEIIEIIRKLNPDVAAIEDIFFSANAKSAIQAAQTKGVVILACVNSGIEVFEYTPLQVKMAVVGYGKAPKEQIQKMVKALLRLSDAPQSDHSADALAVAICYSNREKLDRILKSSR